MKFNIQREVKNLSNYEYDKFKDLKYTIGDKELFISKGIFSVDFKDKDGNNYYLNDEPIIQHISIEVPDNPNINYTPISDDKILSTSFSDFEEGDYLVIVYNLESYTVTYEILQRHNKFKILGGCFSYDVEHKKKILAYVKIE